MQDYVNADAVRVGQVFTSLEQEGPIQSAALVFDKRRGASLLVPYIHGAEQFATTAEWFDTMSPPPTLLFGDSKGFVTLVGVRFRGNTSAYRASGTLGADVAIHSMPRQVKAEYQVKSLLSTLDGLEDFAEFTPIRYAVGQGESGRRVDVTIERGESVSWESGGFEYSIRSSVAWEAQQGRRFDIVDSAPRLETTSDGGAKPQDHLSAQWPIRALLVLLHGKRLPWRAHWIRDQEFPVWVESGDARSPVPVETQFAGTLEEHGAPVPAPHSLSWPAAHLRDFGADGMRRWTELYADQTLRQAVDPAVEVVNGVSRFLEPQLMMLAISLDYFGHYRYGDGRRRSLAQHVERCLDAADLDWPAIGTRRGIANAIAAINNNIKHPDRPDYPGSEELRCVRDLAVLIARGQLLDLIGLSDQTRVDFLNSADSHAMQRAFTEGHLSIQDSGAIVRSGS